MKGEDLRHDRCICRPGFGGIRKTFGLLRRPREFLVCPTPQAVGKKSMISHSLYAILYGQSISHTGLGVLESVVFLLTLIVLFCICKIYLIQQRINLKYLAVALYLVQCMRNGTRGYVSNCRDVSDAILPGCFPLLPGSPQLLHRRLLRHLVNLSCQSYKQSDFCITNAKNRRERIYELKGIHILHKISGKNLVFLLLDKICTI